MNKLFATAAALVLSAGTAFAADPLEGMWQTEVDDGHYALIDIKPCADKLCGYIAHSFEQDADGNWVEFQSANEGKMLVIDMVNAGGGKYDGQVWRPSNDKVYLGKMTLNGNQVDLAGCVLGGLVCASQHWVRASQ